jgi:uncharacterized protein (DUF2147 family)
MTVVRFACILFLALLATTPAGGQIPTPAGLWMDASKRIMVRIVPCGDRLCGKLVWFKWPDDEQGLPVADVKNRNPALRTRPLLGLTILRDLRRAGERRWEDGEIYDPEDGENYRASMSIQDDGALRVRAYEYFPIFGETHIWTRVR